MEFGFYKYQGTGNDFVIVDNRENIFPKEDQKLIADICHRRFGVGADGLILLENDMDADFKMVYFNSDGHESSMCGNGGRCIVHFANFLGIFRNQTTFKAVDGMHEASIEGNQVSLKMVDVNEIFISEEYSFLDTGSPHHVQVVTDLKNYDVFSQGKKIRNTVYGERGANINFVEKNKGNSFSVRTYERGVEDETLSCGTGVTAVALAISARNNISQSPILLETPGGQLQVRFEKNGKGFKNIYLQGPAVQVFKGLWKCIH